MPTKHIHIYLNAGKKTKDAGFDESKHKRDHGQFSTTAGDASHHEAQAEIHGAKVDAIGREKVTSAGYKSAPGIHHYHAERYHAAAAKYLRRAAVGAPLDHPTSPSHQKTAEGYAQQAKEHEARLSTESKPKMTSAGLESSKSSVINNTPSMGATPGRKS